MSAINHAHKLGITSELQNVYSLALGVSEVTLLELTNAYASIAAGGMRGEPILISKVVDREGRVLEENTVFREEVVDAQTNYMITSLLESVIEEGYGRNSRLYGFNEPAAGKTGTTDECTDAWFVGFTPEIAVGVWSGFDEKRTMGRRMTGARVSLPTWSEVMKAHYRDHRGNPFTVPEGIVRRVICRESGLLQTSNCTKIRREVFIEGTEPRRTCDRHGISTLDALEDIGSYEALDQQLIDDH
jgi:penicillin-binding protein 1A